MFTDAYRFNQPIGDWNTAAVTGMSYMFTDAEAFNQPIGDWNTAAVTGMSSMFTDAEAFNQPIVDWNTSAVADMDSRRRRGWGQSRRLGIPNGKDRGLEMHLGPGYGWVFAFVGLGIAGMRFRRTVDQSWQDSVIQSKQTPWPVEPPC